MVARGIPGGGDLEYSDQATLSRALSALMSRFRYAADAREQQRFRLSDEADAVSARARVAGESVDQRVARLAKQLGAALEE